VPIGQPRPLIELAALFVPPSDGNTVTVYPPLVFGTNARFGTTVVFPGLDDEQPPATSTAAMQYAKRSLTQTSNLGGHLRQA
jgi:hypothetical protein